MTRWTGYVLTAVLTGVLMFVGLGSQGLAQSNKGLYGGAPKPIGPYSPGVQAGDMVFLSGQIGLDPDTGNMVPGGVAAEASKALDNLSKLLSEAGLGPANVVRATVYLADIDDYGALNDVYAEFFDGVDVRPARSTVAVAGLPRGARVEIDFIAVR